MLSFSLDRTRPRSLTSAISVNLALGPPRHYYLLECKTAAARPRGSDPLPHGRMAARSMPHASSVGSPGCSGGSLTHCPGQALSRTVRMTSLHSRQISGRPSSRASCSSRLWHSPQRQCPHGVAMDQTVVPGSSGRKVPKQQLQSLVYSACCRIDSARSSSTRYLAKRILTAVGENLSRVARASLRDN